MKKYIVATIKSWNIENFHSYTPDLPGAWELISTPEELTVSHIREINPEYIFFPHWSWKVSKEITDEFNCVCFHMTDLPYGRGGSPLQNLIMNDHKESKITALKMTDEIDAGPIYIKESLSLSGSADEIFRRASNIAFSMICAIIKSKIQPIEQQGEATYFQRRTPEQSSVPEHGDLKMFNNYVRMLDGEGYPNAFIDYGDYRLKFTGAEMKSDEINATVRIIKRES